MNIPDEVLKDTTLADGSELKLTKNSLIHVGSRQGESNIRENSSFFSKFSSSSNKDNTMTDISLESIDAVQYTSQLEPKLNSLSAGVFGLGVLSSLYCWYNFGLNDFAMQWFVIGVVALLMGAVIGWELRDDVFVEHVTIHLSSGEKFEYSRRDVEIPENAPVELLWIVQELRHHSYN